MYLVFKKYSKRKTYNLDLRHSKINAKIKSENSIKKYMYHKSDMMGEREDGGCLLYTALGFCHLVQTKVQFSWKKSHTSRVLLFHLHILWNLVYQNIPYTCIRIRCNLMFTILQIRCNKQQYPVYYNE